MNLHYVKIAGAVGAGILGAKIVETGVKKFAGMVANAAAKIAAGSDDDAPEEEQPKPEAPEKKDGQGKKDDNKNKNPEKKEEDNK